MFKLKKKQHISTQSKKEKKQASRHLHFFFSILSNQMTLPSVVVVTNSPTLEEKLTAAVSRYPEL